MGNRNGAVLLGGVGFCLYRTAASYLYDTAMGVEGTSVGFVSDLRFVYVLNVFAVLAALVILAASRNGRYTAAFLPQWPALAAVVAGIALNVAGGLGWLPAEACMLFSAALCGIALMLLCIIWLEIFVSEQDVGTVLNQIVVGYLLYTFLFAVMPLAQGLWGSALSLGFLLLSAVAVHLLRRVLPTERPAGFSFPVEARFVSVSTFLCFFVLVGVVGIMHTSILGSTSEGILATVPMWVTRVVSLAIFLLIVYLMGQHINAATIFRISFPVLIGILSLLPFLSDTLGPLTGAVAIICYEVCGMVFFLFLVREGRRLGLSGYYLGCVYMIGSSSFLLVGLSIGLLLRTISASFGFSLLTMLAFVAIYPLVVALMFQLRRDRHEREKDFPTEDVAVAMTGSPSAAADPYEKVRWASAARTDADRDLLASVTALLGERYGLTHREREILAFLACGRSVRYIAETLVISENTVWTHVKRIYAKMDAHNRQEVMDTVQTAMERETVG